MRGARNAHSECGGPQRPHSADASSRLGSQASSPAASEGSEWGKAPPIAWSDIRLDSSKGGIEADGKMPSPGATEFVDGVDSADSSSACAGGGVTRGALGSAPPFRLVKAQWNGSAKLNYANNVRESYPWILRIFEAKAIKSGEQVAARDKPQVAPAVRKG
jgi:hypothetical protein